MKKFNMESIPGTIFGAFLILMIAVQVPFWLLIMGSVR